MRPLKFNIATKNHGLKVWKMYLLSNVAIWGIYVKFQEFIPSKFIFPETNIGIKKFIGMTWVFLQKSLESAKTVSFRECNIVPLKMVVSKPGISFEPREKICSKNKGFYMTPTQNNAWCFRDPNKPPLISELTRMPWIMVQKHTLFGWTSRVESD